LHVAANQEPILVVVAIIWEAFEFLDDLDSHEFGFPFLDHIDFLDGFLDIKDAYILSEFA